VDGLGLSSPRPAPQARIAFWCLGLGRSPVGGPPRTGPRWATQRWRLFPRHWLGCWLKPEGSWQTGGTGRAQDRHFVSPATLRFTRLTPGHRSFFLIDPSGNWWELRALRHRRGRSLAPRQFPSWLGEKKTEKNRSYPQTRLSPQMGWKRRSLDKRRCNADSKTGWVIAPPGGGFLPGKRHRPPALQLRRRPDGSERRPFTVIDFPACPGRCKPGGWHRLIGARKNAWPPPRRWAAALILAWLRAKTEGLIHKSEKP